jgi:hypothetical protein
VQIFYNTFLQFMNLGGVESKEHLVICFGSFPVLPPKEGRLCSTGLGTGL